MFIAAFLLLAKMWKQPKYQLMNEQNVVYPHNRIFFSHKKEYSSDTC